MTAAGHYMKALTFALQGEIFAIDAEGVREILDLVPITEVPSAPDFANGLINVRGRVVPLADLRVTFGMERPEPDTDTRIVEIEIELGGEPAIVGILADKVHDVADIVLSDIEQLEEKVRHSATMPQTDRCLKEALDLLVREGAQVANLLTKSAEHATFQEEIGSTLHDAIAAINFLRAEARNVHAATGSGDGNLAEEVAFAQLKGRYTMASERALHDQYSGLPVNAGPKQPDVSAPEFDLDDIFL